MRADVRLVSGLLAMIGCLACVSAVVAAPGDEPALHTGFVDPAEIADPTYSGKPTDDPLTDLQVVAAYKAAPRGMYSWAEMAKLGLPVRDLPAMLGLPACPTKDAFPDTEIAKPRAAVGEATNVAGETVSVQAVIDRVAAEAD